MILPRQAESEQLNLPPGLDLPNNTLLRPDEVTSFFPVSRNTVYPRIECGKVTACKPNGGAIHALRDSNLAVLNFFLK